MSLPLVILAILMCLLVGFYRMMTASHDTFRKMGIETPPTGWMLGNFVEQVKLGVFDAMTIYYTKFKGRKAYGWYDSRVPVLILRDLDLIKDVLVRYFNHFTDRRFKVANDGPMVDNLLDLKGDHWKHVRHLISPTFSTTRVKRVSPHVERCGRNLVQNLRERMERNEPVELAHISGAFTLDAIASTEFGIDINSLADPNSEFAANAKNFFETSLVMPIINIMFPELYKPLYWLGFTLRPKAPQEFFSKLFDAAYAKRKEISHGEAMEMDLLDTMIRAESDSSDVDGRKGMTRAEMKAQAIIFIFAGYDSVAASVGFTLFLLATHPECCKRVQEEIDNKLGKEQPTYNNVMDLRYLDMCVSESMRLVPPGPWFDRYCTEEIEIQGIPIPKGMPVLVPIYAIHHDPDLWPDPEKFDPERFSPENKAGRHPAAYMPFGLGPRHCLGNNLTLLMLKVGVASVLQQLTLVPCDKTVYPFTLRKFMTKAKDELWVKMEARE